MDPKAVPYWPEVGGFMRVVLPNTGRMLACNFDGKESRDTAYGYVPHFDTCENEDNGKRQLRIRQGSEKEWRAWLKEKFGGGRGGT